MYASKPLGFLKGAAFAWGAAPAPASAAATFDRASTSLVVAGAVRFGAGAGAAILSFLASAAPSRGRRGRFHAPLCIPFAILHTNPTGGLRA
jgi:hypothetical protein